MIRLDVTGAGTEPGEPRRSWQAFSAVEVARDCSERVTAYVVIERLLPAGKFRVSRWSCPDYPDRSDAGIKMIFDHEMIDMRSWDAVKKLLAGHFGAAQVRDYVIEARRRTEEARAAKRQEKV